MTGPLLAEAGEWGRANGSTAPWPPCPCSPPPGNPGAQPFAKLEQCPLSGGSRWRAQRRRRCPGALPSRSPAPSPAGSARPCSANEELALLLRDGDDPAMESPRPPHPPREKGQFSSCLPPSSSFRGTTVSPGAGSKAGVGRLHEEVRPRQQWRGHPFPGSPKGQSPSSPALLLLRLSCPPAPQATPRRPGPRRLWATSLCCTLRPSLVPLASCWKRRLPGDGGTARTQCTSSPLTAACERHAA